MTAGAALALTACAPVPALGPPPALREAATLITAAPDSHALNAAWWQDEGDAQLTALIEEGLVTAPSLAMADARLRQAQAMTTLAAAPLLPALSADANLAVAKQSYNNGIPAQFVPHGYHDLGQASLNVAYQLDFFGRNRAGLRAATSDAAAAEVEAAAARMTLSTSIGAAYADLAARFTDRDMRAEQLRIRQESARLVAARYGSGIEARGPLREAEAAVDAARVQLSGADAAITLSRHQLAALIGAGPERGEAITRPTLAIHPLPATLSLDLVGRRADLVAARLHSEAEAARIAVAHADFYPNINLMGLLGLQSLGIGNLVASGSDAGNFGAAISLPIFSSGSIGARYRGARASYDAAVASYDATLIRVVREVADAATRQQANQAQLGDARAAVRAAEDGRNAALQRYRAGLSAYQPVLVAEDGLLRNRQVLAELEAQSGQIHFELIRALGGGFSTLSPSRPQGQ